MIRVTCDHCSAPIDHDKGRWLGVDVAEPIEPAPDPVQAMNDAEDEMIATITSTIRMGGGDHEFHFCGESCLTAWSMDRQFGGES